MDIGPGAGVHGGEVVAAGTRGGDHGRAPVPHRPVPLRGQNHPRPPRRRPATATASPSGGRGEQPGPHRRVHPPGDLHLRHRGVRVGGKSSLVNEILFKTPGGRFKPDEGPPRQARQFGRGLEFLDKVIAIDQSPIGRTPGPTPPPTPGSLETSGSSLPPPLTPSPGVRPQGGSVST